MAATQPIVCQSYLRTDLEGRTPLSRLAQERGWDGGRFERDDE